MKIKKILAMLGAGFMSVVLTGCSLTEPTYKDVVKYVEVPPNMLFLGDSIAAGYGLKGYSADDLYSCYSYSNLLAEDYKEELEGIYEATMTNKAVSGLDSQELLDMLESGELDEDLEKSDAVVISIGGNDLLWVITDLLGEVGITAENQDLNFDNFDIFSMADKLLSMNSNADKALDDFEYNLRKIGKLANEKTEGKIYIQTVYNPFESVKLIKKLVDFTDEKIEKLNKIIKNNTDEGYSVIDVEREFRGNTSSYTNISSFDIHPNADGHKVISHIVDEALRENSYKITETFEDGSKLTSAGYALIFGGAAVLLALAVLIIALLKKVKN